MPVIIKANFCTHICSVSVGSIQTMLMLMFSLFLMAIGSQSVVIDSSFDLEKYICNSSQMSRPLHLFLNHTSFTLSSGSFCQLSHQVVKITTTPHINNSVIKCTYSTSNPQLLAQGRRGLVFFNSSVIIERVTFDNCGTFLTSIPDTDTIKYLNGSYFRYSAYRSAVLVFVHCTVSMTEVHNRNSFGFAIIGANLYNSTISNINIFGPYTNFTSFSTSIGSGMLIHYYDHESNLQNYSIVISRVKFYANIDYDDLSHEPLTAIAYNRNITITNAAGLTIINTMKQWKTIIAIHASSFTNNFKDGCSPGGMLVIQRNPNFNSNVIITDSTFEHNINMKCQAGGLAYYLFTSSQSASSNSNMNPLEIYNTTFKDHTGAYQNPNSVTGAVFIGIMNLLDILNVTINIQDCSFINNVNPAKGNSLHILMYNKIGKTIISLVNTTAKLNSQYLKYYRHSSSSGTFYFHGIDVYVSGESNFEDNYGSVLVGIDSIIVISGEATFIRNTGVIGPAIQLQGSSYLIFANTSTSFIDNHALDEGGAIYIDSNSPPQFKCVITIDQESSNVIFINNSAVNSGNSLYISNLDPCYTSHYLPNANAVLDYYTSNFIFKGEQQQVSSQPIKICDCYNGAVLCDNLLHYQPSYPGRTIAYNVMARDGTNRINSVYTSVNIDIITRNANYSLQILHDASYFIMEGKQCTRLSFKITSNQNFNETLYVDITLSLPNINVVATGFIEVKPCPLGFELRSGLCQCSQLLSRIASINTCNIENNVINRPFNQHTVTTWMGIVNYSGVYTLGVSLQYPEGYCPYEPTLNYCSTEEGFGLIPQQKVFSNESCSENSLPICLYNRTGALCGQCIDGYSVVFGSTECRKCSNWWLLTLIGYTIAGPLFIYLLYALKLTLTTGTINCIIFYTQMTNVGILDLLTLTSYNTPKVNIVSTIAALYLSLTNGNLGFSVCFYNGLTEVIKAGLCLLFPLYLLAIVIFLIILSRYSLNISNRLADSSVQVLVTVVHFSFSKLLLSVIDVLSSTNIETESRTYSVWFFDGSVEYSKGSHLLLMIITLVIVTALLLPYILILLFAKPLRRTRLYSYIRPYLEAIHAPYKAGKEHFFIIKLILIIIVYVVYAFYRSRNIFILYFVLLLLLVTYLIFHTYCKPFHSNALNILYCWLMFNVAFIGIATWYFLIQFQGVWLKMTASTAVFFQFITFILIIIYHFLLVKGKLPFIMQKFNLIYTKVQSITNNNASNITNDSLYESVNYREPLINSIEY